MNKKLYAVKNDEGKYWDFRDPGKFWKLSGVFSPTTNSKEQAELVAKKYGGHVVTFIEEPEKVVLTKEQAEFVDDARYVDYPAHYITQQSYDEKLLMNAYVNGYTVEKEKKYLVELDGLVTTDGAKQYLTNKDGKWFASRIHPSLHQAFTGEELNNAPEWVKQLNREEVTDDDD